MPTFISHSSYFITLLILTHLHSDLRIWNKCTPKSACVCVFFFFYYLDFTSIYFVYSFLCSSLVPFQPSHSVFIMCVLNLNISSGFIVCSAFLAACVLQVLQWTITERNHVVEYSTILVLFVFFSLFQWQPSQDDYTNVRIYLARDVVFGAFG